MAKIQIPELKSREELFDFLVENKSALIAQKKFEIKKADALTYSQPNGTSKALKADNQDVDSLQVKSVINTTNLMDSHSDVHIKGIWKKSLRENKNLYLLQEHEMKFDKIISDEVKASAEEMTWKELGFNYKGTTQALVFDSTIKRDRNPFMFGQYQKGFVKNHSVGMQYVKIDLAIDSDEEYYKEEKKVWDKYISEVANQKDAEAQGYFWAVTEAKIIEGSAVPMGSNVATPTLSVESKDNEPGNSTQKNEPLNSTRTSSSLLI